MFYSQRWNINSIIKRSTYQNVSYLLKIARKRDEQLLWVLDNFTTFVHYRKQYAQYYHVPIAIIYSNNYNVQKYGNHYHYRGRPQKSINGVSKIIFNGPTHRICLRNQFCERLRTRCYCGNQYSVCVHKLIRSVFYTSAICHGLS